MERIENPFDTDVDGFALSEWKMRVEFANGAYGGVTPLSQQQSKGRKSFTSSTFEWAISLSICHRCSIREISLSRTQIESYASCIDRIYHNKEREDDEIALAGVEYDPTRNSREPKLRKWEEEEDVIHLFLIFICFSSQISR